MLLGLLFYNLSVSFHKRVHLCKVVRCSLKNYAKWINAMILVPIDFKSNMRREFSRLRRTWVDVATGFVFFGTMCSVIGCLVGPICKGIKSDEVFYLCLVIILLFLFTIHYLRRYQSECSRNKGFKATYEQVHLIAEYLRSAAAPLSDGLVEDNGLEVGTPQWADHYVKTFRNSTKQVCLELKKALEHLGYHVSDVCIKLYNKNEECLHVVTRTDATRGQKDEIERVGENPFFRILLEVHQRYSFWRNASKVRLVKRNRTLQERPRFLALGALGSKGVPDVLGEIMRAFYERTGSCFKPEEIEEENVRKELVERVSGSYRSCLGVMISKQVSIAEQVGYEGSIGFIGIDSHRDDAWDFLDGDHVHLIASIADILYHGLVFYRLAREISKDNQGRLPLGFKR